MKQEWKWIKSSGYVFEYPIQDESDAVVQELLTWLQDSFGPSTPTSDWVLGVVIKPVKTLIVKPIGATWASSPAHHPLWLRVRFDNEANATMFKLRWM